MKLIMVIFLIVCLTFNVHSKTIDVKNSSENLPAPFKSSEREKLLECAYKILMSKIVGTMGVRAYIENPEVNSIYKGFKLCDKLFNTVYKYLLSMKNELLECGGDDIKKDTELIFELINKIFGFVCILGKKEVTYLSSFPQNGLKGCVNGTEVKQCFDQQAVIFDEKDIRKNVCGFDFAAAVDCIKKKTESNCGENFSEVSVLLTDFMVKYLKRGFECPEENSISNTY